MAFRIYSRQALKITTLVCINCWIVVAAAAITDWERSSEPVLWQNQGEGTLESVHPGMATLQQCPISATENTHLGLNFKQSPLEEKLHQSLEKIKNPDGHAAIVSVDAYGAIGDGTADDTRAFLGAWQTACSLPNAVFLVPEGKTYLVQSIKFHGPCKDGSLIVQIAGTVVAPDGPTAWDRQSSRAHWLLFSNANGLTIQGGGVIDGSGQKWWAQSCKRNKANPCRSAPTALTIDSSSNVMLRNLRIQNSQQMHIAIARSIAVQARDLRVFAPGNSPNTDGIHITGSQNVLIQGCSIGTGDDCISIVSGSANVRVKNIVCGPGHGISIGSLGKDNSEAFVSGIVVDGAMLTGTANGLRIKTWQGGSGFAHGFRFQNVLMNDVSNPIIIDQYYCDSPKPCKNQSSAVRVSEVMYINVSGTSRTAEAMKFACSDTVPCQNIILANINLRRSSGDVAGSFCNNAIGYRVGYVSPSADCLEFFDDNKPDGDHQPQNNIQVRTLTSKNEQCHSNSDLLPLFPSA